MITQETIYRKVMTRAAKETHADSVHIHLIPLQIHSPDSVDSPSSLRSLCLIDKLLLRSTDEQSDLILGSYVPLPYAVSWLNKLRRRMRKTRWPSATL